MPCVSSWHHSVDNFLVLVLPTKSLFVCLLFVCLLFCLALCSSICASWYSGKDSVDLKWFLKLYFWVPFSLVVCLTNFHHLSFLVFSTIPTQLSKTKDLTGSSFLLRLWPRNCLQVESQSSLMLHYLFSFSQGKQPYTTCGLVSENRYYSYLWQVGKSEPSCSLTALYIL